MVQFLLTPAVVRSIIALFVFVMFVAVPPFRHAVLYNFLPLCGIGFVVIFLYRAIEHQAKKRIFVMCALLALCFHFYNCLRFGVNFAFDSPEYWSLAKSFASGHGLSGLMYRTPLYPALVAIFVMLGDHSGLFVTLFQHALLLGCIPGIYLFGRMFGFSQRASCIASAFVCLNSLLMQAAGFIMTEIVFLTLSLVSIALLKRLYDKPSLIYSILSGVSFAVATYCRQLLFPVLLFGLVLFVMKKRKKAVILALIALAAYFGATAPWCLRNYLLSGRYAMSASFGAVAFTKAATFDCLDRQGKYFQQIEKPLENVLSDLSLIGFKTPSVPEDGWQVNRIPHVLIDSLKIYHGFSYAKASSLLGKAAVEGFKAHPLRYLSSIGASFLSLLFEHHDMYPDAKYMAPINTPIKLTLAERIVRGFVYISGFVFLLFPLALLFRRSKRADLLVPFVVVCLMYGATAVLQIGLTRYTIPWEPLKALCAAYVVETIFVMGKYLNIKTAR